MSKLFNFIDTESQRNCAGELRAEDLPAHEHHLLYYTKEQCEAMFALAQHNHDERYYTKDDVFTRNETYQKFAQVEHNHNSLYYTKHEVYNKNVSDNRYSPKEHQHSAEKISVNTTNFNKHLSKNENTVQRALDKIDDLNIGLPVGKKKALMYCPHTSNQWQATNALRYEEWPMNKLYLDYRVLQDNFYYGCEARFETNTNSSPRPGSQFAAGIACYANNKLYNGDASQTNVAIRAGVVAHLSLSRGNDRITIGVFKGVNNNPIFRYDNSLTGITYFSVGLEGEIRSKSLAGEGEALLKALSDGTIVRAEQIIT